MGLLAAEPRETDRQLLDRYVQDREEAAFADLVERHAGQVRRVCRTILEDDHAVDEVTQDTFLLLARKSAIVPWQQSVGSWLSAVAYRLAHKRRCTAARRRSREGNLLTRSASDGTAVDINCVGTPCQADPLDHLEQRELHGALDHELQSLPKRYRAPLELCYLQGKSNRQAADELGWPAGSIARRLARARTILQRRLVLRGFVVAGVAFLIGGLLLTLAGIRSSRSDDIRQQMALFREADFETALARVAEGRQPASAELLALAQQTAEIADRIGEHGSAKWQSHSQAMGSSARELATAIEARDEQGMVAAANRLRNSCVQCHQAFHPEPKNSGAAARRPDARLASRERQRPEDQRVTMHLLDHRGLTPPARHEAPLDVTLFPVATSAKLERVERRSLPDCLTLGSSAPARWGRCRL